MMVVWVARLWAWSALTRAALRASSSVLRTQVFENAVSSCAFVRTARQDMHEGGPKGCSSQ